MRLPSKQSGSSLWILVVLNHTKEPGLMLGLRPANERRRYKVTPSLIGWAQTYNQPWDRCQIPTLEGEPVGITIQLPWQSTHRITYALGCSFISKVIPKTIMWEHTRKLYCYCLYRRQYIYMCSSMHNQIVPSEFDLNVLSLDLFWE